jgi:hypothetical protein
VRPDRDVVVLRDDVDLSVRCVQGEVDLRMTKEKVGHHLPHGKLGGGDGGRAANGSDRLGQPVPYGGLRVFGFAQHRHRMAVELRPRIGHPEPSGRAVEQPCSQARFELLDAMAQG